MSAASDPGLERTWAGALAARERRGFHGDAQLVVEALSAEEADALDALPWPGRPTRVLSGSTLRVQLSRYEAAVSASGVDPLDGYRRFAGREPRDLPAERAGRREHAAVRRASVLAHPAAVDRPELAAALSSSAIRAADAPDWLRALDVVAALPVVPVVERSVLSARLFGGDAHVLDADAKVERLARGLLDRLGDAPAASVRELWLAWGVESDPLSSTVLTINLEARPGPALTTSLAALHGGHAVLTLAQLEEHTLDWVSQDVFVCENPAVVRAAQRRLGPASAPLVCTGGWPSAAVGTLLGQLAHAGARLHHHGDFDWDGLAIHEALVRDFGIRRWRFDAAAYATALHGLAGSARPLGARRRAVSGELAAALAAADRHVPEELVLDVLLSDLACAGRR